MPVLGVFVGRDVGVLVTARGGRSMAACGLSYDLTCYEPIIGLVNAYSLIQPPLMKMLTLQVRLGR